MNKRKEELYELVGKGSFSCIVLPPVKQFGSRAPPHFFDKRNVGKVVRQSPKTQREIALLYRIQKQVDPKNVFTVPFVGVTKIDYDSLLHLGMSDQQFLECIEEKRLHKDNRILVQLVSRYVIGNTMWDVLDMLDSVAPSRDRNMLAGRIIHTMNPLLKGLCELEKNDICHRDLHPGNVMIDSKSSKTYIIDFGFSSTFDRVLNSSNFKLPLDRWFLPPECKMIAQWESHTNRAHIINSIARNFECLRPEVTDVARLQRLQRLFGKKEREQIDRVLKRVKILEELQSRTIAKKFDVYHLGITMKLVLSYVDDTFCKGDEEKDYFDRARILVDGMCNMNPFERFDASQSWKFHTTNEL